MSDESALIRNFLRKGVWELIIISLVNLFTGENDYFLGKRKFFKSAKKPEEKKVAIDSNEWKYSEQFQINVENTVQQKIVHRSKKSSLIS